MIEPTMKPIPGYEERYSATEDGKIFSHIKNKFLSPNKTNKGYLQVLVSNGTEKHVICIHRLVCLAFHGIPKQGEEVNHINFNRMDNRASNLEWVTHSENCRKSYNAGRYPMNGTMKGAQAIAEIRSRKIYGIDSQGNKISFNSLADARRNGFSAGNICSCIHGKRSIHKGYKWFLEEQSIVEP